MWAATKTVLIFFYFTSALLPLPTHSSSSLPPFITSTHDNCSSVSSSSLTKVLIKVQHSQPVFRCRFFPPQALLMASSLLRSSTATYVREHPGQTFPRSRDNQVSKFNLSTIKRLRCCSFLCGFWWCSSFKMSPFLRPFNCQNPFKAHLFCPAISIQKISFETVKLLYKRVFFLSSHMSIFLPYTLYRPFSLTLYFCSLTLRSRPGIYIFSGCRGLMDVWVCIYQLQQLHSSSPSSTEH